MPPSFMLDQNALQDHRRARRAPGLLAFPSDIMVDACMRRDGWDGTALQVTRADLAGFLNVSALGNEEQRVRVTIRDGGVREATAAARRDRPAGPQGLPATPYIFADGASAALADDILVR